MDENNNIPNMGPDPSILSGSPQQPQGNPYGQPQQPDLNQYSQPQQPDLNQYSQPQQPDLNQYSQPQQPDMNQYSQPQQPDMNQYAQPQVDPYAQQAPQGNPYAPQGDPYAPQGDPYAPQGDPYAPQGGPAMEFNSQPQQPEFEPYPQTQQPGGFQEPPKKKKTGLIIGIIIAAVVLIGGGIAAYFLFFRSGSGSSDIKGAEAVCKEFLEAYSDLNVDKMFKCVPEEFTEGVGMGDLSGDKKEVEQTLEFLKGMFEIDDIKILESEMLSDSDLSSVTDKVNSRNNTNLTFDKGAKVKASFVVKVSLFGQSQEEESEITFTCGYRNKRWYIIDSSDNGSNDDYEEITTEEITEVETTESDSDNDLDDSTEADQDDDDDEEVPFTSTAPSKVVEAPAGMSENLEDMELSFDGKVLKVPFALSEFPSDWKLVFELDEDEKTIAAGETSYSRGYRNEKYDSACNAYLNVKNETDKDIPYEEGSVIGVTISIAYNNGGEIPEVILPKGITWGSNEDDIKAAYGDDYSVYDTSDGDTRTLTFNMNDYKDTISLYIDKEDGLNYIYINHYEY